MQFKLSHPLFEAAKPVMGKIEEEGFEVYFVGGCVRDTLLNRPIHDIDLASSAKPDEIEAIFKNTVDLGKEHGTIIVIYQGQTFEITTFRTEGGYSDFRRPDQVDFVRNLEEDTLRRDFTINALAFDAQGKLYDYHQGYQDLEAKLIKAVGNPYDRFEEDALRMVRALRFSAELGFKIEEKTLAAIKDLSENIVHLSRERIRVEMSKLFRGDFFYKYSPYLLESGVFQHLPLCQGIDQSGWLTWMQKMLKPLNLLKHPISEALAWTLFVYSLSSDIEDKRLFLKTWTHSNQLIHQVEAGLEAFPKFLDQSLNLWDIYQLPIDILREMEMLFRGQGMIMNPSIDERYESLTIKTRQEMVVDGHQVMEILGLEKAGPMIGQAIQAIEYQLVMGNLANSREAISQYLHSRFKRGEADVG